MIVKTLKVFLIMVLLVAGSVSAFAWPERPEEDPDEAAWIFNSPYLDLYLAGDWDQIKWREFDKYGQHPPAANYVFGIAMHAIGEPVRSLEPRRFWFENDLRITLAPLSLKKDMRNFFTYAQLTAARRVAALFAALCGLALFFLAWRLSGPVGGAAAYVFFMLHPLLGGMSNLGTADSLMAFLSVVCVLLSIEMGISTGADKRRAYAWAVILSLFLGFSFAAKIVAYAWVVPMFVVAAIASGGGRGSIRAVIAMSCVVVAAFGVAYLLDPGLHGSPVSETLERFGWRMQRVSIQRIVFAEWSIIDVPKRILIAVYYVFFAKPWLRVVFAPLFALGMLVPFLRSDAADGRWNRIIAPILCLSFFAVMIASFPLAWERYVASCIPFIALVAGGGFVLLIGVVCGWRSLEPKRRIGFFSYVLLCAVIIVSIQFYFGPKYGKMPREITDEEHLISKLAAMTLLEPGKSRKAHEILFGYFETIGEERLAKEQREILESVDRGDALVRHSD